MYTIIFYRENYTSYYGRDAEGSTDSELDVKTVATRPEAVKALANALYKDRKNLSSTLNKDYNRYTDASIQVGIRGVFFGEYVDNGLDIDPLEYQSLCEEYKSIYDEAHAIAEEKYSAAVKEFQEAERQKADKAKRDYHEKLENQERELLKKLLDKYGHDVDTGK